jgi:hypothetical protein
MKVRAIVVAAIALLAGGAAGEPSRFEPWIAVAGSLATPSGRLTTAYAPVLSGGGNQRSSRAGQTLSLEAARGPGLEAGLAFFPSRHFGLQVLGSYSRSDLGGANGPYDVHLVYSSIQPPGFEPREFSFDDSVEWPDTVGRLRRLTLGVGAVARFGTGRGQARVFAGLAYHRVGGEAESLAYTAFNLGGHSVLFSNESHLAFALEDTGALAVHLGAQGELALGARAAALLGVRYLGGGDVEVPIRLERIVNAEQLVRVEPVRDIQAVLRPAPARISPGTFQLVIGLKLRR